MTSTRKTGTHRRPVGEPATTESERRLAWLLRVNPTVVFGLEPHRSVPTYVTANVSAVLGYAVCEVMMPQWWHDHLHPDDRARALREAARVRTDGHTVQDYRFLKRDGSVIWVLDERRLHRDEHGSPVEITGGWTDITRQKEAEARAISEAARAQTLARLAARLSEADGLDAVLRIGCEETALALRVPAVTVMLPDPAGETFRHAAAIGLPSGYLEAYVAPSSEYTRGLRAHGEEVIVLRDAPEQPGNPNAALHRRLGMRTMLVAPVLRGGELVGALTAMTLGETRAFSAHEQSLMRAIADTIGITVEKAQLVEQLKEELRVRAAAEQRCRATFDSSFQGAVLLRTDGTVLEVNRTALEFCELQAGDVTGGALWAAEIWGGCPEEIARLREHVGTAASGRLVRFEMAVARPDGTPCIADCSIKPVVDEHGDVTLLVAEWRDVTTERAAEAALLESAARLKEAQRIAQLGSWTFDVREDRLRWSDEVYRIFERDPQRFDVTRRTFLETVHPEDRAALNAVASAFLDGGRFDHEHRLLLPDGRVKWVHERAALVCDASSRPVRAVGTIQDITDRKRADLALQALTRELESRVAARTWELQHAHAVAQETGEELGALVHNLAECVVTIDEHGIVRRVNPAIERVFGYRPDEVIGRNVSILMPQPHRTRHDGYLERYLRTGEARIIGPNAREVEGLRKDGRTVPLELGVNVYTVRGRRFFTGILRDITERKRFVAELKAATLDAEAANQAKSVFLAAMSHEIRTPMNGIVGVADLLMRSRLTEDQADNVETLRDSAYALLGIIDDILDFSKIEAGRVELERVPTSVVDLAESVCDTLGPIAARNQVDISLFIEPRLPAEVLTDPTRLRQVLFNLVGNAVKFSRGSPRRRGRVWVRAARSGTEPEQVAFTVADNGIGMTPETLERVFDAFAQAESSTTRRYGGSGLGLTISQRLIGMMGGTIGAESEPGTGSTFRFTVPLAVVRDVPPPPLWDLRGLDCVVVAGAYLDPGDLCAYLEHAGARVEVASDVDDAVLRAADMVAPVILHDTGASTFDPAAVRRRFPVPGARYLLFTRGRRRFPRLHGPGVAAIDANRLRCTPLLEAVALATGRVSPLAADARASASAAQPTATDSHGATGASRGPLILVAEDHDINRKVILRQVQALGRRAEVVADGIEALRRWRTGRYGLLLTDLHMPGMDGYELARRIRAEEPAGQRLPIIALTANAIRGEDAQCRKAGMDAYLAKPVPLDRLDRVIEQWLSGFGDAAAPPPAAAARGPGGLDVAILQLLVGDDPDTVREFLGDFLVSAERSAAQMHAAWERGNLDELANAAHKLKSAARTVGARALGDLCAQLEEAGRSNRKDVAATLMPRFEESLSAVQAECRRTLSDGPRESAL